MKRDVAHLYDTAVLLLVAAVVGSAVGVCADASTRPLALTLGLAAVAVLAFRRRQPTVTLVLSGGLVLGLFAVNHAAGSVAVMAPAVALYTLALTRGRMHLVGAIVASAAAVALAEVFLSGGNHTLTLQTAGHVVLVAVPVLAAEALRNRRSYIQLLLGQLEQAEQTREREAERRAEQERLRIARELHDVVAHTLTTINVQAGVAKHLLQRQPEHAEGALATIEAASHDALQELRAILGVLREPGDDPVPLEPAPGLDAVGALIDQARSSSEISFESEGVPPERIAEAVQLAAFRIVQESLTNSRRHAPGAPAAVTVAYGDDRLRLTVENPTASNHNGSRRGTGVIGMHERAAALGGTLQAGRSHGCFRVAAELPYRLVS